MLIFSDPKIPRSPDVNGANIAGADSRSTGGDATPHQEQPGPLTALNATVPGQQGDRVYTVPAYTGNLVF